MCWCSRMRTEKLGHIQDAIVTAILPKKMFQWMVVVLSNNKKFCPWSLITKGYPFLSLFLSATQVFQGHLMFLCSSKQAVRCFVCLGCAMHCLLASCKTHESWGKQFSQLFVLIQLKPTLRTRLQARKKWGPDAQLDGFSLLLLFIFVITKFVLWRKSIYRIIWKACILNKVCGYEAKSLVAHFVFVTRCWEYGILSTFF